MAPDLTKREKDLYEEVWEIPGYAANSPGAKYVDLFVSLTQPGTLLDAGCGSGKAGVALAALGYDVTLADLTGSGLAEEAKALPFVEACIWKDLFPVAYMAHGIDIRTKDVRFDWTFCCDVMEHLPEALTMLAVSRLLAVARQGAFFSICFTPDNYGAWVGQALHQTVRPFQWWKAMLSEVGRLTDARDLAGCGSFMVVQR